MSAAPPAAVVFNCGYNGLSIVQDLGRRGVPCVAMDTVRSVGTLSRYARFVPCPDPAVDESGFVDFLYAHCAGHPAKPVLFPTNDHYAMAVSRHKRRLEEVAVACVGDWEGVRTVIDKDRFYALGQERGYRTPRTFALDELAAVPDEAFPLAAKPTHRRVSADAGEGAFHDEMDRLRPPCSRTAPPWRRSWSARSAGCRTWSSRSTCRGCPTACTRWASTPTPRTP